MSRGARPSRPAAALLAAVALAVALLLPVARADAAPEPAPTCTPAQLNASATLPGTPLLVSPMPGSADAMPQTQISLLGAPARELRAIRVSGSRSGRHAGRLEAYSQGDGASFVPARQFDRGELVRVTGRLRTRAATTPFSFSFRVGDPDPIAILAEHGEPQGPPGSVLHFRSAPRLHPSRIAVTVDSPAAAAGGDIFLATYPGPGQTGPEVFAPDGQLVYFKPLPSGVFTTNVEVQRYRGKPVLTWWQGTISGHGFGLGEGEIYSRSYRHLATVHAGDGLAEDLHELQLTSAGTALITAWKPLYCDLSAFGGKARSAVYDTVMQEIDIKTGLVMYEWDPLDHVALSDSYVPASGGSVAWPWDYFHLNSINVDSDGSWLISARATFAVYDLSPTTGQINWTLGGQSPSFAMAPGTASAWQHDARQIGPDTFTLFDNDGATTSPLSHGLVVQIDPSAGTETLVAEIPAASQTYAETQGDLELLPDGNWWLGWGSDNLMSEESSDGTLLYEATTPTGAASYRTLRYAWHAQPHWRPTLALERSAADTLTLYASWNGATDVARWRVLAGASRASLTAVGPSWASQGFQTTMHVRRTAFVAVEALDARGAVIGRSKTLASAR